MASSSSITSEEERKSNSPNLVLERNVVGARRLSNYWWASVVLIGGLGFLLASASSYLQINLLPFSNPTELVFIPQGIAMGFYGIMGLLLSGYLWVLIALNVGGGTDTFDKDNGTVRIFRWGFLGKNRKVDVTYPLSDVQSIRVDIKEGINPKRSLYLQLKGNKSIPLTRVGRPVALAELENQGAELARFLSVPLEGL